MMPKQTVNYQVFINGVQGIVAKQGDNISFLASQGGITQEDFKRFNELKSKNLFIEIEKQKYPIDFQLKPLKQTNFKLK